MKTLLFLRHAEAEPGHASGRDHARALTAAGRRTAERMGRFLAEADALPDHVLCSSATRARQTLEAAEASTWTRPTDTTDALYDAASADVLVALRTAPSEAASLLLVGHEPTWSAMVGRLIGMAQVRMPTAAIACVDLDVRRWDEADFGRGTLCWLVVPNVLQA